MIRRAARTPDPRPGVLVLGLGGTAFGREQRAARMFGGMTGIRPLMGVSRRGDGSAVRLMAEHGLPCVELPFGYLGWSRPGWTAITLAHVPLLFVRTVWAYWKGCCRTLVFLNAYSVLNALPSLLFLRYALRARIVFYLGDVPGPGRLSRAVAWLVDIMGDTVIVNSEGGRNAWVEAGVERRTVRVIYNGVGVDRFAPSSGGNQHRGEATSRARFRVGFVGQLCEAKGVWDFVSMAETVALRIPTAEFLVAGPLDPANREHGELAERAAAGLLRDRFRLLGWVERVEDLMVGLDVLVVPSRAPDASPNVCLEAMASGVPVVATRVGGVPELVADQETGLLVPPGEPDALADAVLRLARDATLRGRMGAAGRLRAETRFDVAVNAREVEEAILTA